MNIEQPRLQFTVYTKKIQLGGCSGPDCEIKKKAYSILKTKLCFKN